MKFANQLSGYWEMSERTVKYFEYVDFLMRDSSWRYLQEQNEA